MLTPSQLALAADCPLRAVLSFSAGLHSRLPKHPAAERGALFHTLLELAAKGAIPRPNGERAAVETELSHLLDAAETRLSADPATAHFSRLDRTLPAVEWHNLTRDVVTAAEQLLTQAPAYEPQRARGSGLDFAELPGNGRFAEVRIDAPDLRLSGRMDVVETHTAGCVVVHDYKTGKIRERDGSILPRIALQLRLYALAIKSVRPDVEVNLSAVQRTALPIAADEAVLAETYDWLQHILQLLPARAALSARSLARPGPECAFCSFRHVCPGYLDEAPGIWLAGFEGRPMPFDTWGTLGHVEFNEKFNIVEMVDVAGRRVRITRLDTRHGDAMEFVHGRQIYLFGLATQQRNIVGGRYFQPRNFFELPADATQRRAWSLAVFNDEGANGTA
jgi:RecB family exonuclease